MAPRAQHNANVEVIGQLCGVHSLLPLLSGFLVLNLYGDVHMANAFNF